MPETPPTTIDRALTLGMRGPEVQMAKVQLVRRRFMNVSEYHVIAPDYYSAWTREAVRSFQTVVLQRYDDEADGTLTPQVRGATRDGCHPRRSALPPGIEGPSAGA